MSARALFIANPVARGAPPPGELRMAAAWLETQGWESSIVLTEREGHATVLARDGAESGYDVVVACGGDGTVNEVANGLAGTSAALAVIRGGTANVWAKEVGIPRDPSAAVRLITEGRRRRMDLGAVESEDGRSRFFLLMAGLGLDGRIVSRIPARLKQRLGAGAYVLYGLREVLRLRAPPATLVIDGETIDTDVIWLLAANTRSYGGVINVARNALADDGLLDVYVFCGRGLRRAFAHALRIAARRLDGAPNTIFRRARSIEISSPSGLECQVDGDSLPFTPRLIRVVPNALTVLLPAAGKRGPFAQENAGG